MLNTMCVSGIGIMFAIFLGFGLTLDFPIGICMLEAYFYNKSIGPKK